MLILVLICFLYCNYVYEMRSSCLHNILFSPVYGRITLWLHCICLFYFYHDVLAFKSKAQCHCIHRPTAQPGRTAPEQTHSILTPIHSPEIDVRLMAKRPVSSSNPYPETHTHTPVKNKLACYAPRNYNPLGTFDA